jgi:protein-L-isoaspartate(D-aspartate) O-methyltransferase
VYTIERIKSLFLKSKSFLASINYHPKKIIYGDGHQGFDEKAPYDAIIVTAGANQIPNNLVAQLKNGGVMVIPIGNSSQKMIQYSKKSDGEVEINEFGDFKFVPMLNDTI